MIKHSIAPYNEPLYTPPPPAYPITPYIALNSDPRETSAVAARWGRTFYGIDTKIGYASYIGNLAMQKGDWLVSKGATYPFEDYQFLLVVDIQEVHYMAHWRTEHNYPLCLHLKNAVGMLLWGCPEDYITIKSSRPSAEWGKAKAE